jgi:hypothetical protein
LFFAIQIDKSCIKGVTVAWIRIQRNELERPLKGKPRSTDPPTDESIMCTGTLCEHPVYQNKLGTPCEQPVYPENRLGTVCEHAVYSQNRLGTPCEQPVYPENRLGTV